MYIILKGESNLPIYEQIVKAVKEGMVNGTIHPGDMLPSIRSLAKDLQISVITTKRAYEELEKEGLISSAPGKGFYINHSNPQYLKEQQVKNLENELSSLLEDARKIGLTCNEIHSLIDLLWEGVKKND